MIGRHKFASGVSDSADPSLVLASDWNAEILLGYVLTNRTGGTLTAGDVVALDTANDKSVVLADTASVRRQFVVFVSALPTTTKAPASTIAALEQGLFLSSGVGTVKVAGTVTRGNYLRKSATSKALEDTGVTASAFPPVGAVAMALQGSAGGTIPAVFYGAPLGSASLGLQGFTYLAGQRMSATTYVILADVAMLVRPSDGSVMRVTGVNSTVDITVAGPVANGRDQAGAFAGNQWVYIYVIGGQGQATATLVSASPTAPTLPSGYTHFGLATAQRLDNAPSFAFPTVIRGQWTQYMQRQTALESGTAVVETSVSLATYVPPEATDIRLGVNWLALTEQKTLRIVSGMDYWRCQSPDGTSGTRQACMVQIPNLFQTVYYNQTQAHAIDIDVLGFALSNGAT